MKKQALFNAVICTAAMTAGAATFAQSAPAAAPAQAAPAATAPANQSLNIRQVYDLLEKQGYRNITEIELDRREYDVKADNAQGQRVELDVDVHTGRILSEHRDD